MKRIFLTAIIIISFFHNSWGGNKGFVIEGNVIGIEDSTMVFVHNTSSDIKLDSTYVINGQFTLKGQLDAADYMWLYTEGDNNHDLFIELYIGNENVLISGNLEKGNNEGVIVRGSKIYDGYIAFKEFIKPLSSKQDSIRTYMRSSKLTKDEKKKKWNEISEINKEITQEECKFIKDNTSNFYSIMKLYYIMQVISKDSVLSLYSQFPNAARKSKYGKAIKFYAQSSSHRKGDDYIDFSAVDINGKVHKLSEFTKDYIFLVFCRPGCPGSDNALKQLGEIKHLYKDSMEVVTFFETSNKNSWETQIKKFNIDWLTLSDFRGSFSETILNYDVYSYPSFFLIDKNRQIVHFDRGCAPGDYLIQQMRKVLTQK